MSGKTICAAPIGVGALEPGVRCALPIRHRGDHSPPPHVPRGTPHLNPFVPNERCLRCDRCGNNMWYPVQGQCDYCARRAEIGMSPLPQRSQCACGSPYAGSEA